MKRIDLKLSCVGIGSLPHDNAKKAFELVKECFLDVPFFPQLAKVSRNEDMTLQILEGMPGLVKTDEKVFIDNESDEFFEKLEEIFIDFEEIIADINSEALDKYGISEKCSSTFPLLIEAIKNGNYKFAKGQVVGPFTLATTLCDKNGRFVYYDETLREIVIKLLTLKVLWQIREMKRANSELTPIIFMDEPSISQLGTSAFITIPPEEVQKIFKQVSDTIKEHGGLSAIHCCGKCDWPLPIASGIGIINLDAYCFAQNLSLFSKEVKTFLENDGIIAWGVVPTLDKDALEKVTLGEVEDKFEEAVNYLEEKGIDRSLIINQSMISTSCGAGGLTLVQAEKAVKLTRDLSAKLKEK